MKKFFKKILNKIWKVFKDFFLWVWKECRDWRTLLLLVVVCLVVGFPAWGFGLIFFITGWKWIGIVSAACFAFWWIPGMPFFAVAVSITLAIKKIGQTIRKRKADAQTEIQEESLTMNASPNAESLPRTQEESEGEQ